MSEREITDTEAKAVCSMMVEHMSASLLLLMMLKGAHSPALHKLQEHLTGYIEGMDAAMKEAKQREAKLN